MTFEVVMKSLAVCLLACCSLLPISQQPPQQPTPESDTQRTAEIQQLKLELQKISARLDQLEQQQAAETLSSNHLPQPTQPHTCPATGSNPRDQLRRLQLPPLQLPPLLSAEDRATLTFFRGTTLNFGLDGYYGYNFNQPFDHVNQLRAYDVSTNSFSVNQATVMVEHLPQPLRKQRFGGRIDLSLVRPPRPFRVLPPTNSVHRSGAISSRPTAAISLPSVPACKSHFGKWASALGNEGNYTKDQIDYSRGFRFDYLPFYHMGLRANYNLTPRMNVAYWLVNRALQTEDFNGFKSQAFIFTLKPASAPHLERQLLLRRRAARRRGQRQWHLPHPKHHARTQRSRADLRYLRHLDSHRAPHPRW